MKWIEVSVSVQQEAVEAVCSILMEAGAAGVAIDDPSLLFQRSQEIGDWDYVELPEGIDPDGEIIIKAWLQQNAWLLEAVQQIKNEVAKLASYGLQAGSCQVACEEVEDQDWATAWKAYYKPIRVGRRLLIRPVWEESDRTAEELEIALDPGLAFGTGTHPTTRLCLQALEDKLQPGNSFLDVGCGSGILTIAAALLGAEPMTAVDIDELAVTSTKANLGLNHLQDRVRVIHGNLVDQIKEPVQVVVANIVADAILRLLPDIFPLLLPAGVLIASGIILAREEEVVHGMKQQGLEILEIRREGEWVAVIAQKVR